MTEDYGCTCWGMPTAEELQASADRAREEIANGYLGSNVICRTMGTMRLF
jgi:hypothetical protein